MEFMGIMLLSAALSMDAFNIGVSCGFGGVRIGRRARLVIFLVSSAVTGAAVIAGELLSGVVPAQAGKIAGAILLICLGLYMSLGALKSLLKKRANRSGKTGRRSAVGSGVLADTVRVIGDASDCDADGSKTIDCREAAVIGAALSADSFAAGFGAGLGCAGAFLIPLLCGGFQLIFLFAGEKLAGRVRRCGRLRPELFAVASGGILLLTAVIRLIV